MTRFLYFYLTRDEPDIVNALTPAHVEYWQSRVPAYFGQPSVKRSGVITFLAANLCDAQRTVLLDPFARTGVLEHSWVKEFWSNNRAA